MADLKISQLTGATTPLAGTEVVPVVQSGTTKKVSVANLTAGRTISATPLTWASLYDAHAVKSEHTSLFGFFDGNEQIAGLVQGAYINSSFQYVYTQSTQPVARAFIYNGAFYLKRAPAGTAGAVATEIDVITTDANGNKFLHLPTSSAGLPSGALWNDAGTVKVIP